jgi:hypothetical protein
MAERKRKYNDTGSAALVGSGAVVGTTGAAAGGIPGAKSDFAPVANMKRSQVKGAHRSKQPKVRNAAKTAWDNRKVPKAAPGGIFGFRTSAHRGGLYDYDQKTKEAASKPVESAQDAFKRGRTKGKIAPEQQIIRHMKRGKAAANAAMIGGAGLVATGVGREVKDEFKKSKRQQDTYNGALAGGGATAAGVSHVGSKVLTSQGRKWERRASDNVDRAGRIKQQNKYKQRTGQQGKAFNDIDWPKTMNPKVSDKKIKQNPDLLKDVHPRHAEKAGELRGAAAQQRHFAEVYRNTSKVVRSFRTPSAVAGAIGAGGLAVSADSNGRKNRVKKSSTHSAFGVDHGL